MARAELLPRMYPPEIIDAFAEFKGIWDPDDRMNPGRVVRPAKLDEDLRVFVGMPNLAGRQALAFTEDRGSFARASRRCLGVGRCVTASGGVMCPSYRATGEEQHSTRGRARLLFEMANGEVIEGGWRSPEVAEALDLCLSCKGCKRDCPVGVDMAAYKTEYLARRYRWRLRPASHYSMGALPLWLWLVGKLPPRAVDVLNAAGRGPLGRVAKRLGGVAPERAIPVLARDRVGSARRPVPPGRRGAALRSRAPPAVERRRRPAVGAAPLPIRRDRAAAAAALADRCCGGGWRRSPVRCGWAARSRPDAPTRRSGRRRVGGGCCCGPTRSRRRSTRPSCGRPRRCSPSWGTPWNCRRARCAAGSPGPPPGRSPPPAGCWAAASPPIEPWLTAGVPVVGLEPSCTAALRADAAELLPDHPLVPRLATGVRTFAELLAEHTDALRAAVVAPGGRALVQVHCHQHAELGTEADRAVMAALGVDAEVLDSGCCGLAGNFGFEKGHYAVSMACAERVLLPGRARRRPGRRGAGRRLQLPHPAAPGGHPRAGAPGPAGRHRAGPARLTPEGESPFQGRRVSVFRAVRWRSHRPEKGDSPCSGTGGGTRSLNRQPSEGEP